MYSSRAWEDLVRNLLWLGGIIVAVSLGLGFLTGWLLT